MDFLLIQNKGVAPVEGYTTLGYSSTRNCGTGGVIGQFGSGAKHAINLCLRNNLKVYVFCGTEKLEFGLEREVINDGLQDDVVFHVTYKQGQRTWKRTGWVLDFGLLDWDNIGMGLREFISNALDRSTREDDFEGLNVAITSNIRAKAGFTRIYVEANKEVQDYFGELDKHFLHFSDHPNESGVIEKPVRGPVRIYREGVFIRELKHESYLIYNLSKDDIKIDECRNSSEYYLRAACAKKLAQASPEILTHVIQNLDGTFEAQFEDVYLRDYGTQKVDEGAFKAAFGDAVICDNKFSFDYTEKKGYKAVVLPPEWAKTAKQAGVKTAIDVLNVAENNGCEPLDPTEDIIKALDNVWECVELLTLSNGKEKPPVFGFRKIMDAGSMTHGFCDDEGIHISVDIGGAELRKTVWEEVSHWVTGATDNSRDFQNYLIDVISGLTS